MKAKKESLYTILVCGVFVVANAIGLYLYYGEVFVK
jgi:hypothetical protein